MTLQLNMCLEKLNVLFPFHLMFDQSGRIVFSGKSNTKLFGDLTDKNFNDVFKVKRPSHISFESKTLHHFLDQVIILDSKLLPSLMFRGQFIEAGNNNILFAGSPWMTDVNDLERYNLNITDFAIHNTITDMMQILNSNQMVMNDIKELVNKLKDQKTELNNANTRLKALIQNLQSAVLVEDENRHIVLTNQTFCNIFNIPASPNELIGMDCANAAEQSKHLFIDPERFTRRIDQILHEKQIVTNEILYLIDGTILERDFIPIINENEYSGHLWQYKDVTLQKKTELQIKHNEEKFRSVIENLKLGLLEVDRINKITKVYPQFCELTGYSENELLGKDSYELMFDSSDLETMKAENMKRAMGESGVYDLRIRKKNGEYVWVTVSGAPIYDLNNQVTGSIGINLDITDRKQKEDELRNAKEIAERSVKTKQQFLSNVSHEIRTPLNVIIGMSDILMNSSTNPDQKDDISIIKNSANHLLSIINDILDLAKIESGKIEINATNIRIRSLIKDQIQIQNVNAKNKGLKLHYNIDPLIPEILVGDETKLNQILTNLINNSIKFTEKGFIYLEVKAEDQSKDTIKLHISVSDTGIGIPPDKLTNVFESFSQANNHFNKKHAGTGLGLAIVKNIVELCNGTIWVESEINRGSTFHIILPLRIGNQEIFNTSSENELDEEHLIKNKHILIVEDNKLNQVVAKRILENWGCITDSAMNGNEALEKLRSKNFDVILMDIQMPEMDGFETTTHIRKQIQNNTPIIAMTAYSNPEIRDECMQVGMNEIVSKPFKKSELKKTLANQLRSRTNTNIEGNDSLKYLNNDYLLEITNGDPDLLNKLIQIFLEETPKNIQTIKQCINNKDIESLKTAIHKYKSSVRTFQIKPIEELIKQTELLLDKKEHDPVYELAEQIVYLSHIELNKLKQHLTTNA